MASRLEIVLIILGRRRLIISNTNNKKPAFSWFTKVFS
jgi:hypothetical protein